MPDGRVLIAWDDGPLEPTPTWTCLDDGVTFPDNFVAGYDTQNGRQGVIDQTQTGTATVYINDYLEGLFDNRNLSSPYYGKLSGRQIKLQLYNPVTATWEPQFRGLIDSYTYDIDGSAVNAAGEPINASIQIECVDMFDYLEGYLLTPGLDGIYPAGGSPPTSNGATPAGSEDSIYYAETSGTLDDRIIEVLTDAGIDPTMWIIASGNVKLLPGIYNVDDSALSVIRDAADADLPFIANIYINRHGQFVFRGRYSRFTPDTVAAEPGSDWDFTRWAVGDGAAILADSSRAQLRDLQFARDRSNLINAAMCSPKGISATDVPGQIYANAPSITAYGKHQAQPMTDLLVASCPVTGNTPNQECFLYAKLLVENQKDPRAEITSLQVKAIRPDDPRATATWDFITKSDISHIANVAVGYPGGTGFAGGSPQDDHYIEGRSLQVRPLNSDHDYVEYDIDVSPAVWSMDTNGVFA